MAHLVAYAQMSTDKNALAGNLVKAQCDICGSKFGSLKEAKDCEANHIRDAIGNPVKEALQKEFERSMICHDTQIWTC